MAHLRFLTNFPSFEEVGEDIPSSFQELGRPAPPWGGINILAGGVGVDGFAFWLNLFFLHSFLLVSFLGIVVCQLRGSGIRYMSIK